MKIFHLLKGILFLFKTTTYSGGFKGDPSLIPGYIFHFFPGVLTKWKSLVGGQLSPQSKPSSRVHAFFPDRPWPGACAQDPGAARGPTSRLGVSLGLAG